MKKKPYLQLIFAFVFSILSLTSFAENQTYTAILTTPMFTDRDFELPDAVIKYEQHSEDIIEVEFFDNDTKVRITFSEDATEEFIQTTMDDFELNWEQ